MADKISTEATIKYLSEKFGEDKTEKLIAYMDGVLEKNEHINLTAVRDRDEAVQKHIVDSLSCFDLAEYANAKTVLDMGTGGGFPGVPLAIVSPDKSFTLVDALNKRLKVIGELSDSIGLTNVVTVHARAEEIGRNKNAREKFDVVVSRAVASLDVLAEWCLPLVKPGGYMIAYKGENVSRETLQGKKAVSMMGGEIIRQVEIENAAEDISGHVLLVIKKIKNTPAKYPRQPGQAKKNPLR